MASDESQLRQELEEFRRKLGKKDQFEAAVASITSILRERYASASPSLRDSGAVSVSSSNRELESDQLLVHQTIARVSTILQSRYVAPYFWKTGLSLFEAAEQIITEKAEIENIKRYIAKARAYLHEHETEAPAPPNAQPDNRYLFEGHLTMQQEPPPPAWLVAQQTALRLEASLGESSGREHSEETNEELLSQLVSALNQMEDPADLQRMIDATLLDGNILPKAYPASKEVVANLPVVDLDKEAVEKLGPGTECAVCKENLVVGDKMQELPCKHLFHPPCLKPWLDEHNSCPICRFELKTDDHVYENWKEREKEAEEERRGAANAVRGGEFMYI